MDSPWILTVDNIFLDVAQELPDNSYLENNGISPGSQNTAMDDRMKRIAKDVLEMKDGEYGSKKMSETIGGCALNTSRAANFFLQAKYGSSFSKVKTIGCIGDD
jgi:hypothetical protein